MALDHVALSPEQAQEIEALCNLGQFSETEWRTWLIQEGIHGLRLHAAAVLYTTQPLTISEVADQVHLTRGELIDWFHAHGIMPWMTAQEEATASAEWDSWVKRLQS